MTNVIYLDELLDNEEQHIMEVCEHGPEEVEAIILDGHDYNHCTRCGDLVRNNGMEVCDLCYCELLDEHLEYLSEFDASERG